MFSGAWNNYVSNYFAEVEGQMVRIVEDLVYPANNHRLSSLGLRNYNINSLSSQKRVPAVNLTEMSHMLASKP